MTTTFLIRIGCVAAAGALGAVSRWGVSHAVVNATGGAENNRWFFLGTLSVNVVGCFLFGFLYLWLRDHVPSDSHLWAFVFIGFLGAFTTFSTFAFDTHHLLTEHTMLLSGLNVLLNVALGWGAFVAGLALGRAM